MDAYASRWDPEPQDGFSSFEAELSTVRPELDPASRSHAERKSARVPVELPAGLRQRGATGVSVQIMDLSIHGFRVATHLELPRGTDVWLRLPKLEPCHARVMWSEGHYVGCAFERPLHPAVLDMIVRQAQGR